MGAAFDAAAQDFNTFVGDATDGYAQKVETIFTKKGDDMAALASLQGDYNEDLLKLLDFDAALHNNDESPATYKTPEELKDMQASFSTVTDELEALATAVEANMRDLASASKDSISEQSASDAELKSEETKLQKAYDDCVEEEESRLEDVPAPVLGQSGPYYELELALKQTAMDATCSACKADLLNTQAMLAGNSNKYAALKAAITARVEEDEALPLIPIIAGAGGALVLIIIVVVLMSGGGGGGSQQGGYGGNGGWGEGQGGSSVVAFENPVYAGEEEGNYDDGYGQEDDGAYDGGGLYDEPEMFSEGGNDGGGAGGSYLDVAPDDEGEDEEEDDDEDEEEEAAEEEDDEEEEEDDDEEEEDDDEDDDDEDDDEDDDDEDDDSDDDDNE